MAQDNEKEAQQLKNRLHELADRAYSQGMFTFTGFLGLAEQDVFWQEERSFQHVGYTLYGGREGADVTVVSGNHHTGHGGSVALVVMDYGDEGDFTVGAKAQIGKIEIHFQVNVTVGTAQINVGEAEILPGLVGGAQRLSRGEKCESNGQYKL